MIEQQTNKQYILTLSYGKDSLACLEAIRLLGLPLDRIIHAEVWATDTIQADLPPVIEFKSKADEIIKKRYGLTVEHIRSDSCAETIFYTKRQSGKRTGQIIGFPMIGGCAFQVPLKTKPIRSINKTAVAYLGIASDEPERITRHTRTGVILPLVEIGWDEAFCREWCEKNDLLSPIYTSASRGGCWFCPCQSVGQLRLLRKNYPSLWELLLTWDDDSPTSFKWDGHTVHDFDRRFLAEELNLIPEDKRFRWKDLELVFDKHLNTLSESD